MIKGRLVSDGKISGLKKSRAKQLPAKSRAGVLDKVSFWPRIRKVNRRRKQDIESKERAKKLAQKPYQVADSEAAYLLPERIDNSDLVGLYVDSLFLENNYIDLGSQDSAGDQLVNKRLTKWFRKKD